MRRYSQMELLSEGFWNLHKSPILRGIGKVARAGYGAARAVTKGGEYLTRVLAPELTTPIDRLGQGAKNLGAAMRQGWDKGVGGKIQYFNDILLDNGWVMDHTQEPERRGTDFIVFARRMIGKDPTTGEPIAKKGDPMALIVDDHGDISNSAYLSRRMGQNPAYPVHKK